MLKISVLVPTRNMAGFLAGCLESLLEQSVISRTEIIVINNASRQGEEQIVKRYMKKSRAIKYLFEQRLGIPYALNAGIGQSRGKYLTNVNADDRLSKTALEIMEKALDKNPGVALVYGDSYVTHTPNETFEDNSSAGLTLGWPEYSHKELLMRCICGPHPMWRKNVHAKAGYFDQSFKMKADYEFWLRMAENYKMLRIPSVLGLYYVNRKGVSLATPKLGSKEGLRIKRMYFNRLNFHTP